MFYVSSEIPGGLHSHPGKSEEAQSADGDLAQF